MEKSDAPEGKNDQTRWPAWMALLTAPFLPATTSRRTAHVSLRTAFAVHVAAFLVSAFVTFAMSAWGDIARQSPSIGRIVQQWLRWANEILDEFLKHPKEAILVTLIIILFIEAAYLLTALLVTPWGARNEPLKSSIVHGLRWTWLHTIHFVPAIVFSIALVTALDLVERRWHASNPRPQHPTVARPVRTPQQAPAEWQKYNDVMASYYALLEIRRNSQPPYVRYDEEIATVICGIVWGWWLWGLLRGVGARRGRFHVEQPPLCEACGYNLTMTSTEARCPECGDPVINSLGPDARPGPIWERRREVGALKAWWRCSIDPVLRSRWFGRQVRISSTNTDHRMFLPINLCFIFLIGFVGVLLFGVADNEEIGVELLIVALIAGVSTLGAALVLTLLSGWTGIFFWIKDKRNRLSAGMQTACYGSGLLTAGTAICWGGFVLVVNFERPLRRLSNSLDLGDEWLMFACWLAPCLIWLISYVLLLYRATAGARYANK
jgi:hypothetical protein